MWTPYFETHKHFLILNTIPYCPRPHSLPLPPTFYVYAESGLIYQLVNLKNVISVNHTLIMHKISRKGHSLSWIRNYITNQMLEKYECDYTKIVSCCCCMPS